MNKSSITIAISPRPCQPTTPANPQGEGKFVLFSWPRCGTTTLAALLAKHPKIRMRMETFNYASGQPGNVPQLDPQDLSTADEVWSRIFSEYNGVSIPNIDEVRSLFPEEFEAMLDKELS